jgi:RNA polymerase sigma factor (sigma-70 family)
MLVQERAAAKTVVPSDDEWFYREMLTENYPLIENVVRFVARRYRLTADEADELSSVVGLKLVENGYAILRKYQGRSGLATYLTTVIARTHLDDRTARWGRWRPSAQARRLGDTAVILERLLDRDRLPFTEACELLRMNYGVSQTVEDLEAIRALLPQRVRRRFVGEEALETVAAIESHADRDVRLDRLASSLAALSPADREVVRLVYVENRAINEIARVLSVHPRFLYRRLDRIRRHLRVSLGTGRVAGDERLDGPKRRIDLRLAV